MAGLSMGGMEAKTITLKKLDTFSHIGLFSGGSIALGDIEDLETFKKSNRLVFVSYGGHELGNGGPRRGGAYQRFTPRTEMDIAVVGVGIDLSLDDSDTCTTARVALGAVAPTPLLDDACAKTLIGTKVDDAALEALAEAASAACNPIDDKRGTVEFRTTVAGVLAQRVATVALERAKAS